MNIYDYSLAVMFPVVKVRRLFVSGSDEVRGRTAVVSKNYYHLYDPALRAPLTVRYQDQPQGTTNELMVKRDRFCLLRVTVAIK